MEPSDQVAANTRKRILIDLRPSLLTLYFKCGVSVVVGGILALWICGQLGINISHASSHLRFELHSHVYGFGSALGCGVLLAILPPFILRMLCSPLQFRIFTRRGLHAPIVWFVGLGLGLAHHGEVAGQLFLFILWCLAALGTFVVVAHLIEKHGRTLLPAFDRNRP